MKRFTFLALCLAVAVGAACGDDSTDDPDVGVAPTEDAGTDTGEMDAEPPPEDAGADTSDASEDAQEPEDVAIDLGPPDHGEPCDGPPGLYIDEACVLPAEGIERFTPQYELWSDGTAKERFIYLPEGRQIDTTDPDAWVYPSGTIVWKNFRDPGTGRRLETRRLEKVMEGSGMTAWQIQTFEWNEADDAVTEAPPEGVQNVLGTEHDIPGVALCVECHADRGPPDLVLGFSAIQLNHDGTDTSLADLLAADRLTTTLDVSLAVVPGDTVEQEALGYLHANCGHCHGGEAPQQGLDMWVDYGISDVMMTTTYMTAVGVAATWPMAPLRVAPRDLDNSAMYLRMNTRDPANQMPRIATEIVDPSGLAKITAWINSLPPISDPDAGT